jgi:large subunit ribosomal protein L3
MAKGILGRKVGMTQIYDDVGNAIPVTVIEAGPCHVLQVRTQDKDGYEAVQLGFLDKPRRLAKRAQRGQVAAISSNRSKQRTAAGVEAPAKANCEPKRFIRELRGAPSDIAADLAVGQEVKVNVLDGVKAVDVTGICKGRGYQGVMGRHNFKGQRATHGVKKVHRHMGTSGGLAAWRGGGRPKKGKKMPGQHGNVQVTVRNIPVAKIDAENNLLLIHGGVPGPVGSYVIIKETNKV